MVLMLSIDETGFTPAYQATLFDPTVSSSFSEISDSTYRALLWPPRAKSTRRKAFPPRRGISGGLTTTVRSRRLS